jgi:hypothetical protein
MTMLDDLLEQSAKTRGEFIKDMKREWEKRDDLRTKLLSEPDKMNKAAAGIIAPFMPKQYKTKKGGETPLEAFERVTPSGHPMKGAATALRDEFVSMLSSPGSRFRPVEEVALEAREKVLNEPLGRYGTRREGLYAETRLAESSLFPDEVKRPPGYEEWLNEVRTKEDIEYKKKGLWSGGEFALGTILGGVVGGLFGIPGGPAGIAAGAAIGAGVGAGTEVISQPIKKSTLYQTEWYRSKQMPGTGAWETIKSAAPEMVFEMGIDAALTKAAAKSIIRSGSKSLSAANIIEVDKIGKTLDKDIIKASTNITEDIKLTEATADKMAVAGMRVMKNSPELFTQAESMVRRAAKDTLSNKRLTDQVFGLIPQFNDEEIEQVIKIAQQGLPTIESLRNTALHKQNIIKVAEAELPKSKLLDQYANAISKANEVSTKGLDKIKWNYGKNTVEYEPVKALEFDDEIYMAGKTKKGSEGWFVIDKPKWEIGPADIASATKVTKKDYVERLKYGLDPKNLAPEDIWQEGLTALAKGIQPEQLGYRIPAAKEIFNLKVDPETIFPVKDIWEGTSYMKDLKSWYLDEGLAELTDDGFLKITPEGLRTAGLKVDDAIEIAMPDNLAEYSEFLVKNSDKPEEMIETLDDYADAIEFFGDETAKSINKPGELTEYHLDIMQQIADSVAAKKLERAAAGGIQGPVETLDEYIARGGKISTESSTSAVKKNNTILRKKGAMIAGIIPAAAIGYTIVNPKEAEASPATTVAKAVSKMIKGDIAENIKQLKKAGLAAEIVTVEKSIEKRHLMTEAVNFAEQGKETYGGTWNDIIKRTKSLPMNMQRSMSPYAQGAYWYKSWANPGTDLGYRLTASKHNMKQQFTVLNNITKDYKELKPVSIEVSKAMEPLAEKYSGDVSSYQILSSVKQRIESSIEKASGMIPKNDIIRNKIAKGIEKKTKSLEKIDAKLAELKPTWDNFSSEWEMTVMSLAEKYPSTRIALAVEDTNDFTKYPWLKSMVDAAPLEERQVISGIKNMMNDYKVRLQAGGHKTISDSYVHHAWHPKWDETQTEKLLNQFRDINELRQPLKRLHQRTLYSKQMMPDISYIMSRYIPDTEKRIQMNQFWKSWDKPMRQAQYIDGLNRYWQSIKDTVGVDEDMLKPGARIANLYTSFEVMRLLSLMPSVAFKHLFKLEGTAASLGAMSVARRAPTSLKRTFKQYMRREGIVPEVLRRTGLSEKFGKHIEDDFIDSYIQLDRYTQALNNMGYSPQYRPANGLFDQVMLSAEKTLDRVNHEGSVLVGLVEGFDRIDGMMAALDMAANNGRTVNQAAYMMVDTIAKNSFYGGWLNSKWMKNPYFRAMLMFQNTPFKLLERRVNNALGALDTLGKILPPGKGIPDRMAKMIKKEGWRYVGDRLKEVKTSMFNAEALSKQAVLYDFLTADKDVFGTQSLKVFGRELLYSSLVFGGFNMAGMDVLPHTFHLPFISHRPGAEPAELGYSPIITGAIESMAASPEYLEDHEVGRFGYFFQKWLGSGGIIPRVVYKTAKLSENDIPDIYQDSPFSYLFAIPRLEKY